MSLIAFVVGWQSPTIVHALFTKLRIHESPRKTVLFTFLLSQVIPLLATWLIMLVIPSLYIYIPYVYPSEALLPYPLPLPQALLFFPFTLHLRRFSMSGLYIPIVGVLTIPMGIPWIPYSFLPAAPLELYGIQILSTLLGLAAKLYTYKWFTRGAVALFGSWLIPYVGLLLAVFAVYCGYRSYYDENDLGTLLFMYALIVSVFFVTPLYL